MPRGGFDAFQGLSARVADKLTLKVLPASFLLKEELQRRIELAIHGQIQ